MVAAVFVLALGVLVALPLAPSIRIWKRRIDSRPLRIHERYDHELHRASEERSGSARRAGLRVHGDYRVPEGSSVGALCVDGSVTWDGQAVVEGWLDARGPVTVGRHARLEGSCASDRRLFVGSGSTFERLVGAPVEFGARVDEGATPPSDATRYGKRRFEGLAGRPFISGTGDRTLVDGDLVLDPGEVLDGSLVVRGALTLRSGATVNGSVTCYGDLTVGESARIFGAAFSRQSVWLAAESFVAGPCVADRAIRLGQSATVGMENARSTVSAPRIESHAYAAVFGIIHATESGQVA